MSTWAVSYTPEAREGLFFFMLIAPFLFSALARIISLII